MTAFAAIVLRDVALAFRAGGGGLQVVLFFVLAALLFALALGPDRATLAASAASLLWAAALFSAIVSFDRMFEAEFEDGSVDTLVETSEVLELRVLAKATAHWLSTSLPVIAAAPIVALLLNLPADRLWPLLASLLVGTPALSLFGAFGSAAAMALRRAGLLVALLTAPVMAPTLIFGALAATGGAEAEPSMLYLAAITLLAAIIGPVAGAAVLRLNMN